MTENEKAHSGYINQISTLTSAYEKGIRVSVAVAIMEEVKE